MYIHYMCAVYDSYLLDVCDSYTCMCVAYEFYMYMVCDSYVCVVYDSYIFCARVIFSVWLVLVHCILCTIHGSTCICTVHTCFVYDSLYCLSERSSENGSKRRFIRRSSTDFRHFETPGKAKSTNCHG